MKKYLTEVEKSLELHTSKNNPHVQKYINTKLKVAGISTPYQNSVYKNGYSFSSLPLTEQFLVWDYIWKNSAWMEAKNQSLFFVKYNFKKLGFEENWNFLFQWIDQVDNWAHSDGLSSYYAKLSEINPKVIYEQLKKWSSSSNPWERRQSLVSLFYYARTRKSFFSFIQCMQLIKKLLHDPDYYVQKGVGWSLRECYQVYEQQTIDFIEENCEVLSSVAFSAATEKYNPKEKQVLLEIRKKARKKQ